MENLEKKQTLIEKMLSLTPYFPQVLVSIVVLLGLAGIGYIIYQNAGSEFFKEIGKNSSSFARGLITILIAFITIVVALILIISVLFGSATDYEKRFGMGREILSIFVGILGTIVGFYFGSAPIDNDSFKAALSTTEQVGGAKNVPTTVYLQFYDEAQREAVKLIQTKLRDSDFHVPEVENVGDDKGTKANPIKQSIIRYYNDSDKTSAEKLKTILGVDFILQKGSTKLKVSPGTIEVWFKTPDSGANKNVQQ